MRIKLFTLVTFFAALTLISCDSDKSGSGKASFYLTDGPLEADNVSAVVISFSKVEVSGPDGWKTVKAYDTIQSINLLDLQNGETFFIDEVELTSGAYGQVRLGLVENEDEAIPTYNYIEFDDESRKALTIPSGSQSGYKIVGGFTIPDGGVTSVTIDFDVRKSVVETGSGKYILKPTLRLIENADVAMINGTITSSSADHFVVYAYENDNYSTSEESANADGLFFANATTSANVNEEGNFTLAFLTSGTYDLYVAAYDADGNLVGIAAVEEDVVLNAGASIQLDLDL